MDVLIATHDRPVYLEETLRQMVQQGQAHGISRIVVIENGEKSGAELICGKISSEIPILYHFYPDANKSAALNYGLRFCGDGLVFMTDDDVILSDALFSEYRRVETLQTHGRFYAGPTYPIYDQEPESWIVSVLPGSAKGWTLEAGKFGPDDVAMGFNWAAYKRDLVEIGGFNPDFGPGSNTGATGQESNMQRRLVEKGVEAVYLPQANVGHRVPYNRCNYEWLLARAKRQGIEYGIRRTVNNPNKITKLMLGQYFLTLRLGFTALLLPTRENRFRWKSILSMNTGVRKGVRLFRSGRLLSPPFPGLEKDGNPSC
jgi:glycosyltransferase involved in cell wall biosynthesis